MRNLKKFLALVLAMMMVFSLMITANAATGSFDDSDKVTKEFNEAVEVLAGIGIMKGVNDGSNFNPAGTLTRAEAATVMYRIVTGDAKDERVGLYTEYGNFADVKTSDWFSGYVGYCANQGIIQGDGAGNFLPYAKIDGYQMLTMLLRAIGYQNLATFAGSDWRTQVASGATQLGILNNINNTRYGGNLYTEVRRDVVAEMSFQSIQKPMVIDNGLGSYTQYTSLVSNTLNPSLGEKWYGLTSKTGIVVGNQATGEDFTKLGVSGDAVWNATVGAVTGYVFNENGSYAYASDPTASGTTFSATTTATNITLDFNKETKLDLFGHKAKVWYDYRTPRDNVTLGQNGVPTAGGYNTVYCVLDQATKVETVWANDLKTNGSTPSKTSVYTAAVNAGFKSGSAPAWKSDRFCQMGDNSGDNAAVQSEVGMYRIISNSSNLAANVVITLNQEVAQITQRNTTIKNGEYIYIGKGSSTFGDELAGGSGKHGKLLDDLLAPGSDKTLGDVVTANEIVGTTWTGMTGDETTDAGNERTLANAAGLDPKYCMYETAKLEPAFTGTLFTYKQGSTDIAATTLGINDGEEHIVTQVTLDNSKTYNLSGITGSKTEYNHDATPDSHLVDKAVAPLTTKTIAPGKTYSFYVDEVGRFIGMATTNDYKFLYGTYADYATSGLGVAELNYAISGFAWNASDLDNQALKSVNGVGIKGSVYNDVAGLSVSKKDQGTIDPSGSGSAGNEIKKGINTGYMYNASTGDLDRHSHVEIDGTQFNGYKTGSPASASDFRTWTITANDVRNGFKKVENYNGTTDIDYLLTSDTKFIVVKGIGINATATVYNGIGELLRDGSSIEIVADGWDDDANDIAHNDEVWFQTDKTQYGNVDVTKNNTITTVILSESNLHWYGAQTMYFAAPGATATGVKLVGSNDAAINQYKLYLNGVPSYYWVKDNAPDGGTAATGFSEVGDFYTLIQIDTVNGQPIYKAKKVTLNSGNHVGAVYEYVVVNNVQTAEITCSIDHSTNHTTVAVDHSGTNWGGVYKVGGAKVTVANGTNDISGLFPDGVNINDVLTLNHAVSMGNEGSRGDYYKVSVAVVYSGIDVSCIYVTNIINP